MGAFCFSKWWLGVSLAADAPLPLSTRRNRFYIGPLARAFELHRRDTPSPSFGRFMTDTSSPSFAARGSTADIEQGSVFQPKFDKDGLIAAIVTDAASGAVLMFAWMNAEALKLSLETGIAHFWSRSRQRLWRKGEESGNTLAIQEARVDCDQDAVWLKVSVGGEGVTCHTGARSCFYRTLSATPGAPAKLTRSNV